jgi:hypothetical protein
MNEKGVWAVKMSRQLVSSGYASLRVGTEDWMQEQASELVGMSDQERPTGIPYRNALG